MSVLQFRDAVALARAIRQKKVSAVEMVTAVQERIDRLNPKLNAYVARVPPDQVLRQAREADAQVAAGKTLGPLHGVPIALKDDFETKGLRTTDGSKVLANYVPQRDATVVARLRAAGAILLGKLNMHELAMGGTTNNPHYGPTSNPWDLKRIPGGSSGGSAAAVAAGLCFGSLGTDARGSVRLPAAMCGLVGIRPSFGRVSRYGVIPLSWSFDTVGPIVRTVGDAALFLSVISGYDPLDPATFDSPLNLPRGKDIRGLRVGVPRNHFFDFIDPPAERLYRQAVDTLARLGATLREVSVPQELEHIHSCYETISRPEAAAYFEEDVRTRLADFGDDVRLGFLQGMCVSAVDYVQAQRVRRLIQQKMRAVFQEIDVMVTPSLPAAASLKGQTSTTIGGRTVPNRYAISHFSLPFSIADTPAVSVPCGLSPEGMPLGIQIAGRPFEEGMVLRVAAAYERVSGWGWRRPPV